MNNVILRKVTVTAEWQPLSPSRLVASVTISALPGNTSDVAFRTVDEPGHEVPVAAGQSHEFKRIDLSRLMVSGEAGDVVTVVGGTW